MHDLRAATRIHDVPRLPPPMKLLPGLVALSLLIAAPALHAQTGPSFALEMDFAPAQTTAALDEVVELELTLSGFLGTLGPKPIEFEVLSGPGVGFKTVIFTGPDGVATFPFTNDGEIGTSVVQATQLVHGAELIDVDLDETVTVEWTCALTQSHYGVASDAVNDLPRATVTSCFYPGLKTDVALVGTQGLAMGWFALGVNAVDIPLTDGSLYVTPVVTIPLVLGPSGGAALSINLPDAPSALGLTIYMQFAHLDPPAAGGLALSAGLQAVLGA